MYIVFLYLIIRLSFVGPTFQFEWSNRKGQRYKTKAEVTKEKVIQFEEIEGTTSLPCLLNLVSWKTYIRLVT